MSEIGIAVKQIGISSLEELWLIQKWWYFQSQDLNDAWCLSIGTQDRYVIQKIKNKDKQDEKQNNN